MALNLTVPSCLPVPAFGLTQQAPTMPSAWTSPRTGFYYVDENITGATDTNNPYGTPAHPRRTIPTVLPAGSAVFLSGQHTASYGSPNTIRALGTANAPVWILGVNTPVPRFVRGGAELCGTYLIVQNISTYGFSLIDTPDGKASTGLVLRGCEVSGDASGGGLGIGIWHGGTINNVVIVNCYIHDTGTLDATTDVDNHGIAVGGGDHHWILNSVFYRCSGDGVQVNGGNGPNWASLHHVFVGGCIAVKNRQSGFWAKQSADVVFANNVVSGMRPNSGGPGIGLGGQYGPNRLWILGNRVTDSEYGIKLASYDGFGSGVVVAGNLLDHLTPTTDPTGGCGLFLQGGVTRLAFNNTFVNCQRGVLSPAAPGTAFVGKSIFAGISGPTFDFENSTGLSITKCLFAAPPTFVLNGITSVLADVTSLQSVIASPTFINALGSDYHVLPTDPSTTLTLDMSSVTNAYQTLYGAHLALPSGAGAF